MLGLSDAACTVIFRYWVHNGILKTLTVIISVKKLSHLSPYLFCIWHFQSLASAFLMNRLLVWAVLVCKTIHWKNTKYSGGHLHPTPMPEILHYCGTLVITPALWGWGAVLSLLSFSTWAPSVLEPSLDRIFKLTGLFPSAMLVLMIFICIHLNFFFEIFLLVYIYSA